MTTTKKRSFGETIAESHARAEKDDKVAADALGVSVDEYRLQQGIDSFFDNVDLLMELVDDAKAKDYKFDDEKHRLTFRMSDGIQYYLDTKIHKAESALDLVEFTPDDEEDDKEEEAREQRYEAMLKDLSSHRVGCDCDSECIHRTECGCGYTVADCEYERGCEDGCECQYCGGEGVCKCE
jgi:hypothetical protein